MYSQAIRHTPETTNRRPVSGRNSDGGSVPGGERGQLPRRAARRGSNSTTSAVSWAADASVLAAESVFTRAVYERKAATYALLVVCGIDNVNSAPDARTAAGE